MCANGTTANVLKEISIPFTMVGRKISTKFHVMEGGQNNIYLGMPFLQKNSAILTFDSQNSLSLIIGVPVLATQYLEITSYSEVVVPGVLQIPVSQSSKRYCSDAGEYSGAHTAELLTTAWFLFNC